MSALTHTSTFPSCEGNRETRPGLPAHLVQPGYRRDASAVVRRLCSVRDEHVLRTARRLAGKGVQCLSENCKTDVQTFNRPTSGARTDPRSMSQSRGQTTLSSPLSQPSTPPNQRISGCFTGRCSETSTLVARRSFCQNAAASREAPDIASHHSMDRTRRPTSGVWHSFCIKSNRQKERQPQKRRHMHFSMRGVFLSSRKSGRPDLLPGDTCYWWCFSFAMSP